MFTPDGEAAPRPFSPVSCEIEPSALVQFNSMDFGKRSAGVKTILMTRDDNSRESGHNSSPDIIAEAAEKSF